MQNTTLLRPPFSRDKIAFVSDCSLGFSALRMEFGLSEQDRNIVMMDCSTNSTKGTGYGQA